MHGFLNAAVLSLVANKTSKSDKNAYTHLSLPLPPFIKSTPPYLCCTKQYTGIQKISIHNKKWYL
jgi:hypothetical protein